MKISITNILNSGGVGVAATDTIYGLLGSVNHPEAVERIYRLKKRNPLKPCIVLISDESILENFGVVLNVSHKKSLGTFWPGAVSVILPCGEKKWYHLHRGTQTIAFRLPDHRGLRDLLRDTGPLIAPSANIEGEEPAPDIARARKYFGDKLDFYDDSGFIHGRASRVVDLTSENIKIIRE